VRPILRSTPVRGSALELNESKVAVIGGGIVGLATLLELARMGLQPVLFEAHGIASGVSGASLAGITRHLAGEPDEVSFVMESAARWKSLAFEFTTTLGLDIELDQHGHIALVEATSDQEAQGAVSQRETAVREERARGLDVDMLDKKDVLRLLPAVNAAAFVAASWCPGDAKLNALVACRAMLAAAIRLGATVHCEERVVGLESGWTVRTTKRSVHTDAIVLATGPWTSELLQLTAVDLPSMRPKRAQCCVTEPLPNMIGPLVSSAHANLDTGYTQLHQTRHGEILFNTVIPTETRVAADGEFVLSTDHQFLVRSAARLLELFPALEQARVLRSWAGIEAWTSDRRFLIGEIPGRPGLFVAAGDSGLGFVRAPLIGVIVAELVTRRPTRFDLTAYSPARATLSAA